MSDRDEQTTLQRLVGLGSHLETMDDATLTQYILSCQEYCLEAGEPMRYDPDQDPNNVDDEDSEYPSANEWIAQRLLTAAQMEMERRRTPGRITRITEIHDPD